MKRLEGCDSECIIESCQYKKKATSSKHGLLEIAAFPEGSGRDNSEAPW